MKNLLNITTLKKSLILILIPLTMGLLSPFAIAGEKKKTERQKQIQAAKDLAIQFAKQALDKLDADMNDHGEIGRKHLDLQLDRVTPVSVDVLKKLSDPRLKITFPEPHEADSPGCQKMQQEMNNEKEIQESKRRHEHNQMEDYEDYDRREHKGALNVLAYVDNKSDWEIHICHAYFQFPNRMDPDPNPLQSKKEARAQILIHEAIHLVLGHTHDKHRTFGEKEKECSWYTYEHMIHSNLNEFYEDGYYTMFGFNLPNFKYHGGVPYKRRYINHVLR
jgi:hypothetical protein